MSKYIVYGPHSKQKGKHHTVERNTYTKKVAKRPIPIHPLCIVLVFEMAITAEIIYSKHII